MDGSKNGFPGNLYLEDFFPIAESEELLKRKRLRKSR